MDKNKLVDIVAVIFLFLGFLLALSPHATHISADHTEYHRHYFEIGVGLTVGILALIVLIYNNKALKKFK